MSNSLTKILILGQASNNRGDEAAARGMIYGIQSVYPDAHIDLVYGCENSDPVIESGNGVVSHHDRHMYDASWKNVFTHLWLWLLWLVGRGPGVQSDNPVYYLARIMSDSDVVVFAPRGAFVTMYYLPRMPMFFIWLAKRYGKKVMIYGPSFGPFKKTGLSLKQRRNCAIIRYILNTVDMITVRDGQSYEYLNVLGLKNKNIFLTSDSAVQNPIDLTGREALCAKLGIDTSAKMLIGITPIELSWHLLWSKQNGLDEHIAQSAAQTLDYCIEKYDAQIVFFPQLYGSPVRKYSTDLPVIYRVIHHMKHRTSVCIVDPFWGTVEQQKIMSLITVFLGFRHHSAVLCAKMKIPCICISYEHKAISFMEDIGLKQYALPLEQLNSDSLCAMIDDMIDKRDQIRIHLEKVSPELKKASFLNTEKFRELLSGDI